MANVIAFKKQHDYLICLDSDGCAIDGMTVKHLESFGPCAIREWKLEDYQEELLAYWNKINLYTLTRGINRFKGLFMLLNYAKEKKYISDSLEKYQKWVNTTKELSNASLEVEITKVNDQVLRKAISWSKQVNVAVAALPNEKKLAFAGVKEALEKTHLQADVAVISAANAKAVEEEWTYNELLSCVDVCLTQEYGSKAACIRQLVALGYKPHQVIMLGDALGDFQSAENNDVMFYPIQVGKEEDSWKEFREHVLAQFLKGEYSKVLMQEYVDAFRKNLA